MDDVTKDCPIREECRGMHSELRSLWRENRKLREALEIIASDEHLCPHAAQTTAQRVLDGGEP